MEKYITKNETLYACTPFTGIRDFVANDGLTLASYKNGLLHGTYVCFYGPTPETGVSIAREYINGDEHGIRRLYNRDGNIAQISHVKSGALRGLTIQYTTSTNKVAKLICCKRIKKEGSYDLHVDFDEATPQKVSRKEGGTEKCLNRLTGYCMNFLSSPEFTRVPKGVIELINQRKPPR